MLAELLEKEKIAGKVSVFVQKDEEEKIQICEFNENDAEEKDVYYVASPDSSYVITVTGPGKVKISGVFAEFDISMEEEEEEEEADDKSVEQR